MAENISRSPDSSGALFDAHPHSPKTHVSQSGGQVHAGTHLLVDFWGAGSLDDCAIVEAVLRRAAAACGATLLHLHLHRFSLNGGVSGVAVLAESHISVHTWPEYGYAAFDVFMCGACDPRPALPILRRAFRPAREEIGEHKRGVLA